MDPKKRVQLHVELPYRFEPRENGRVREYLARGYRIEQLQRISDREALVNLVLAEHASPSRP